DAPGGASDAQKQ
nr:RecName: Full=Hemocyanin subunit 2 [Liocarcinus depurator]